MRSSISPGASITKCKVKSVLVQLYVIKCRLEKQPAVPQLSCRVIYHINSSDRGDSFNDELQSAADKHAVTFKARVSMCNITLIIQQHIL